VNWYESMMIGVGVAAYVASHVLTFQLGRRGRPVPLVPPTICGCEHDYALHKKDDGYCAAYVKRVHYDINGSRNGYEYVRCDCQRFTGQLPAHELIERWQPPPSTPPSTSDDLAQRST
jgi:hypothetical protein